MATRVNVPKVRFSTQELLSALKQAFPIVTAGLTLADVADVGFENDVLTVVLVEVPV